MKSKNIQKYIAYMFTAMLLLSITSCEKDDDVLGLPVFSKITPIKELDKAITTGSMGDWVAIQGTNLESTSSIRFNDVEVDMEEVYYENETLYLQVPVKLPGDITNKVTVTTEAGNIDFNFTVDVPDLKLTSMFNEYTLPGDTIKIYGNFFNLYEVDSSTTVVSFGGIEKPVIKASDTYLTAQVPQNVQSDVKVEVINKKHNVTAVCPGYYQDKHNVITTFDSDFPYTSGTGQQWVGEWTNPKPTSGKYIRFEVDQATYPYGLGWFYLCENSVNYTMDMMTNPDKYVLKFELNMLKPIKATSFFIYYYWAVAPTPMSGETFTVTTLGLWQTVTIPLEKIIPMGYTGTSTNYSLNMRIENYAPVEEVAMYFDNLRIYKEGE